MEKIWKYIIWTALLIVYIVFASKTLDTLKEIQLSTARPFPRLHGMMAIHFGFGFFLGIERVWDEMKKNGRWTVDSHKLLLAGIPFMFLGTFILTSTYNLLPNILTSFIHDFSGVQSYFYELPTVVLGYILSTSIKREPAR